MADADPQEKAFTVSEGDPLVRPGDVGRVVGPHVDDRGGDRDRSRRIEDALDEGEIADGPLPKAEPCRWVAERLGLDDEGRTGVVVVPGVEPCPDASELQTGARRAHDSAASVDRISRLPMPDVEPVMSGLWSRS